MTDTTAVDTATTVAAGVDVTIVTTFGLAELAGLIVVVTAFPPELIVVVIGAGCETVDIIPLGPVMMVKVTTVAPEIVV